MNLKLYLLSRITAAALLCLLATVAYVLHRSAEQSAAQAQNTLAALGKQLEFQLLRVSAGEKPASPFPDFDLWKQTGSEPGICASYLANDGKTMRNYCKGIDLSTHYYPPHFAELYRHLFGPNVDRQRLITYNGQIYGVLTVSVSAEMAIARAWEDVRHLLALSTITISAVCLLVYLAISRALRPAQTIVEGLHRLSLGDLAFRLPSFELLEWRDTATAINQLADNQQQLLAERQKLAVMLMNLQEEERRYLARELHDELGQCLTAIQAVAAGIAQTARQNCPELIIEAEQISRFTEAMQCAVRGLLTRLRPAELEELGLDASLRSLVASWNRLGKTYYSLHIAGDCRALPDSLAISLFRIAQEAISNIAKHAAASQAAITLTVAGTEVLLVIQDNGSKTNLPLATGHGIGLLGMRERVLALNGRFDLSIAKPHGLIIQACLPLKQPDE
ncbi:MULTISPECIES: histidine kinase [Methylomonas]|uniref:Histidine kinase n=2 Tax=Methylomonas TaxID=416 RepID=A0A126T890_9GAMM|nr:MULTISPECIES: histidine kinase [Methylomonas]AMK77984.1 histidine kinase [Methylomonas denitrificans]OAI07777.1 histidine kinase [Methylomonas methanica]